MPRPAGGARVRVLLVSAIAVLGTVATAAGPGRAATTTLRDRTVTGRISETPMIGAEEPGEGPKERFEALEAAEQYYFVRSLPGEVVPVAAFQAARAEAAGIASVGGAWTEITDQPYQSDATHYRDPVYSNSGGGSGFVAGRMQGVAVDGSTVYAAASDGGVWRSIDRGAHWTQVGDDLPSLSGGSIAVNPDDHSVWFGTGEASTAYENYAGLGVYRSTDRGASWRKVGGGELDGSMIGTLAFDDREFVFAATSYGVFRHATTGSMAKRWQRVLQPGTPGPYGFTFANDVAVRPGTGGRTVIATLGWRTGKVDYSGFYASNRFGRTGTWHEVHTRGKLRSRYIGRASFAYSADGGRLYALVESWQYALSKPSALYGIFVSKGGDVRGPWQRKATWHTLARSGSALEPYGGSYAPGVQAWYNQAIGVDPNDPDHVYVGLEEVFETTDGGSEWLAVGPYWNFTLKCFKEGPESCPNTTHPDQHGVAFAGGDVYVTNDGGVYRRPLSRHTQGHWTNLNETLHTLQYYYAGIGALGNGDAYWGGLQDNGVSLLLPGAGRQVSPFGGDGGDVIVDPSNGERAVVEYTDLDMALTTNGGVSDGSDVAFREISPSCFSFTYVPDPCDPNPRFISPFEADPRAPNTHWVAAGEFVWETTQGWDTTCSDTACDWTITHDVGKGFSTTELAVDGSTIYAGWCGGPSDCNPGGFRSGIDTNYGGSWHRVAGENGNGGDPLPNRYVSGLAIDPSDPGHVFVSYGGYERRWIHGGGIGHVFESTDGGTTWTDVTGNLPDVPTADLRIAGDGLVLATDLGVYTATLADPTSWSRLGTDLPNVGVNSITVSPDGSYVVAVTHGRGLWSIPTP
ncbi:MAG: WD40/YVTN/BNR-like repeat-containing protein [Candidatus Velamenicoccus archaeovorus]